MNHIEDAMRFWDHYRAECERLQGVESALDIADRERAANMDRALKAEALVRSMDENVRESMKTVCWVLQDLEDVGLTNEGTGKRLSQIAAERIRDLEAIPSWIEEYTVLHGHAPSTTRIRDRFSIRK